MNDFFVWDVSPVIGSLGPFTFRYYSVLFAAMTAIGVTLSIWQARKTGLDKDASERFGIYIILGFVIGARAGEILFYEPMKYLADPLRILQVWKGGLSSHGAAAGLLLTCYLFGRKNDRRFFTMTDCTVMGVCVGVFMVRIGNFFNSEIVGRIADVPWAVRFMRYDDGGVFARHPAQLYESALGLSILAILLYLDLAAKKPRDGFYTGVFAILYFGGRFFLEYVKEYQALDPSFPFTMGQLLSAPLFALGVYILVRGRGNGTVSSNATSSRT